MYHGLLVSQLPHVQECRAHYDTMLSMESVSKHRFATFWYALKNLIVKA
jgi:hypothetical protein